MKDGQGVTRAYKFSECGTGRWSGGHLGVQIFAMWNGMVVRGSLGRKIFVMWTGKVTRGSLGYTNFRNVEWVVLRGPGRWPGGRSSTQIFAMRNGTVVRGSLGRINFRNVERDGGQGVTRAYKISQCGPGRWPGGRSGTHIFSMWTGKVGDQRVTRAHKFLQRGTGWC